MNIFQKTSYSFLWLVFCFLAWNCSAYNKDGLVVSIEWKDHKATAISIPNDLLKGMSLDSARRSIRVQLEDTDTDILGEYSIVGGAVVFHPLVPYTPGLTYIIYLAETPVTRFSLPQTNTALVSSVVEIYPSGHYVPKNLLKVYIQFSRPMQEGNALQNIIMIRNGKDTIPVFLDLEQELWNKERTILTLWLDPGRIKRGLQPNEQSGLPLEEGQHYTLVIRKKWRNANGLELDQGYRQYFTVYASDSISPSIDTWEVETPSGESTDPLRIRFDETLDYLLLKNAIHIIDGKGNLVAGKKEAAVYENELYFFPDRPWAKGSYAVEVEARLEDLAGNNLNRLFDRDITKKENAESREIYRKPFSIK